MATMELLLYVVAKPKLHSAINIQIDIDEIK
jgi:hypothetical protein